MPRLIAAGKGKLSPRLSSPTTSCFDPFAEPELPQAAKTLLRISITMNARKNFILMTPVVLLKILSLLLLVECFVVETKTRLGNEYILHCLVPWPEENAIVFIFLKRTIINFSPESQPPPRAIHGAIRLQECLCALKFAIFAY